MVAGMADVVKLNHVVESEVIGGPWLDRTGLNLR